MHFGYGIWKEIANRLTIDLPPSSLRNYQKYNQVAQSLSRDIIPKDKPFIFLRFSNGDQKLQDKLHKEGYTLFPNPEFSSFIRDRESYLSEVDKLSYYPLKRVYLPHFTNDLPTIINTHFGDADVVLKVGNLHASEGKYLITANRQIPYFKYDMKKQPITIEEFVPNARSIRIGLIGDALNYENYFITEHINSKTWLKNNAPEEENTYSYNERYKLGIEPIDDLIDEVRSIALLYNANLLGVDWVVSPEKAGLLELNDMIGLPEGDTAFNLFYKHILSLYTEAT